MGPEQGTEHHGVRPAPKPEHRAVGPVPEIEHPAVGPEPEAEHSAVEPVPEAERYFAELWRRSRQQWAAGGVVAAEMQDGATAPIDYCITTVARLQDQPRAPIAEILGLQAQLRTASPEQFFYPPPSLHVSLLGCTQRHPDLRPFTPERVRRIGQVCERVITSRAPVRLSFRGLGITGNQVFVQVFPLDRGWASLRHDLDDALRAIGEAPISYPNKAPIHLNVARVTHADPASIAALLDGVTRLRDAPAGEVTISRVSYLIIDFVLSARHTRDLSSFTLGRSAR